MTNGEDDGSIADDWSLLRRIHPDQIVQDKNTGDLRPSSAAFKDPAMSVDVEETLIADGKTWAYSLRNHSQHSLVKLPAGTPRGLAQAIVPTPEPDNIAHAEVRGAKSGSVTRQLKEASSWVLRR
jgi:hypothetical protein